MARQLRLQKVRESSIGSTALLEKKHRQVYGLNAIKTLDKMDASGSTVQMARLEENREKARKQTKSNCSSTSTNPSRDTEPQLPEISRSRDLIGVGKPMEEVREQAFRREPLRAKEGFV